MAGSRANIVSGDLGQQKKTSNEYNSSVKDSGLRYSGMGTGAHGQTASTKKQSGVEQTMLKSSQFQTRISGAGNGLMKNSMDTGMFNSKMSLGGIPEELLGH